MNRLVLFALLIFLSCKSEEVEKRDEIEFQTEEFFAEKCEGDACAEVDFSWPKATGGNQAAKINEAIEARLIQYFYTDTLTESLQTQSEFYLESFAEYSSDFPEAAMDWKTEVKAEFSYQSDSTLSIYFSEYNFSGGAHPNSSVNFMNFDLASGEVLSESDMILDQSAFLKIAEEKFRDFHQVDEGLSLSEDDRFFLDESGFVLANGIGFKDGKFWVIYVPYEIGPYALGYTELEFDPESLKGIIRF